VSLDLRLKKAGDEATNGRLARSVEFSAQPGEWVILSGESGCGKSSVLDAVAGLWTGYDGRVRFDVQTAFGYATQSPFLLAGTIEENIVFGRRLVDGALGEAVRIAGLEEAVGASALEKMLLDRGSNLSGGQRQRVSLARALAGRPGLLLLDEATANLDRSAEMSIVRKIREAMPRTTVLIVTHREMSVPWGLTKVEL
jgi:ABC-type transport system involved in cytochrome bd biosynthesis fused ATPase/permease subunit